MSFSILFLKADEPEGRGKKLSPENQTTPKKGGPGSAKENFSKPDAPPSPERQDVQAGSTRLSDEALAQAIARGNLNCFEELYDRYAGIAFSLARRILWNPEIAEEVIQEVFLKLWQHPQSFDATKARFKTWLLSAVHHRAIDEVRRRQVRPQESLEEQEMDESGLQLSGGDPEEAAVIVLQRESIIQALATLPPHQRQVIELAYFSGLTQREIADHLSKPLGTVKTWLRQALFKLRDSLGLWQDAYSEP